MAAMNLKALVSYWWTGELPEEKRNRKRINVLLDEQYNLIKEALEQDIKGNSDTAREKREAAEQVSRQIGRIEAGTEDIGI